MILNTLRIGMLSVYLAGIVPASPKMRSRNSQSWNSFFKSWSPLDPPRKTW